MRTSVRKTLLLVLIVLVIFISCHPQEEGDPNFVYLGNRTKIEGKVLEYGTNLPLPGVMLIIVEEKYTGGLFGGGNTEDNIDTIYSNLDGSYSYEFKHRPPEYGSTHETDVGYSYHIESYLPNYFRPIDAEIAITYWNKNRNIILDPYAWIKVHIKNVNPFDENDYLWLGEGGEYYGKHIDTSEVLIEFGNHNEELVWYIGKNGIHVKKSDSLYVPAFDTIPYEILY